MEAVHNVGLPPPWLKACLAKDDFYVEKNKCKTHKHKYETFFCIQCMNEWLCESCHKESIHQNHPTVRVFINSNKPCMKVEYFKDVWDVEKIQPFSINSNPVVYLQERQCKLTKDGCIMCEGKLLDHTKYSFCSIQCQKNYVDNKGKAEFDRRQDNDASPSTSNSCVSDEVAPGRINGIARQTTEEYMPGPSSIHVSSAVAANEATRDRIDPERRKRRKGSPSRSPVS